MQKKKCIVDRRIELQPFDINPHASNLGCVAPLQSVFLRDKIYCTNIICLRFVGRSPLSQVPPPSFSLPWRIAAPRNLRRAELPAPLLPAASLFLVSVTFLLDQIFGIAWIRFFCDGFGIIFGRMVKNSCKLKKCK